MRNKSIFLMHSSLSYILPRSTTGVWQWSKWIHKTCFYGLTLSCKLRILTVTWLTVVLPISPVMTSHCSLFSDQRMRCCRLCVCSRRVTWMLLWSVWIDSNDRGSKRWMKRAVIDWQMSWSAQAPPPLKPIALICVFRTSVLNTLT